MADDDHVEGSIPENEFIPESEVSEYDSDSDCNPCDEFEGLDEPVGCQFVNHDLNDDQRSLGGCPPPTDETGASKLPSETQNISPEPIPEKANQNMAIGNSIDCDNSVKYFPDVLKTAKQNYERVFDMRPGTSTQEQIDRSSLTVTG